jgi:hypothetical protein
MQDIITVKNQWLHSHVEVDYPTPLSLKGRDIYMTSRLPCEYQTYSDLECAKFHPDEIFCADFHRMTIMFALLQAQKFTASSDQEAVLEFLTQIIYSPPCDLYIGFDGGEPVAVAIITHQADRLLCSDLHVISSYQDQMMNFAHAAMAKWLEVHRLEDALVPSQFIVEVTGKHKS